MNNRGLLIAVWLTVALAGLVLGVLIHSRMQHRSPDQKILLQKSHQN